MLKISLHRIAKAARMRSYFKLPFWFKINTPIGSYNPDWAVVFKNERRIYFVAETKDTDQELRESESMKIKCGAAHFKEFKEVVYRKVSRISESIECIV